MVRRGVCGFGAAVGAPPVSHDQVEPLVDRGETSATPEPQGTAVAVEHMADDLSCFGIEMCEVGVRHWCAVEELGVAGLGCDHDVHHVLHVTHVLAGVVAEHQLDECVESALGWGPHFVG